MNPEHICNTMLQRSKKRAKEKQWEFNLDLPHIVALWPDDNLCPVYQVDMLTQVKEHRASLDRVNPTKGYVKGNVRIISTKANSLKNNGLLQEFEAVLNYMHRLGAT